MFVFCESSLHRSFKRPDLMIFPVTDFGGGKKVSGTFVLWGDDNESCHVDVNSKCHTLRQGWGVWGRFNYRCSLWITVGRPLTRCAMSGTAVAGRARGNARWSSRCASPLPLLLRCAKTLALMPSKIDREFI